MPFATSVCRAAAVLPGLASRVTSHMVNNNDRNRPLWYRALDLAQKALVASKVVGAPTVALVPVAASVLLSAANAVYDTASLQHVVAMHSLNASVSVAKYVLLQDSMLGPSAQAVVAHLFTALLYETNNITATAALLQLISARPDVMDLLKGMAAEHGLPLLHSILGGALNLLSGAGAWAVGSLRDALFAELGRYGLGMPIEPA
ncbi:hypothetical protein [Robbsia betulipollinis]|nr:hypothetical protein [Robbsia betulipollinis]